MKLHLPKSLRTALLTCLAALAPWSLTVASGVLTTGAAVYVIVGSSSEVAASTVLDSSVTTTVGDVTYAGYVLTLDVPASNADFHSQTMTYDDGSGTVVNIGTSAGGPLNQAAWWYFANGSILSQYGNTLHLTGIEGNVTLTTTFSAFSIGGLIVDAQENTDYTYKLGRHGSSGYTVNFEAAEGVDVNADINSDVAFDANAGYVAFKNDGTWDIATGVSLTIDSLEVALKETVSELIFQGGGEIDLKTSALSIADGAKLSVAEGTTLRLGANTTVSTGNGVLSNSGQIYLNNHSNTFTLVNNEGGAVIVSGTNTINKLTGNGTVNVTSGTTAVTTAEAGNGSLYNVSSGAALNFTNFTIASGSTVYFAGNGNVSLGTLTNNGVLDFSSMNGAIGTYTITDGFSLDVSTLGNVANAESLNWNSLLGNSAASGYNAVYADGVVSAVAITDSTLHWSATSEGQSWNGNYSWQVESVWANPSASDSYVLGADATYKSIVVDSDVDASAATLSVNGAYSLSVAHGASYSFNLNDSADSITFADGASLTKVGSGTLKMTSTDALNAGIIVDAGILELSTRDNVTGKTITVNENGTLVFGGASTSSSVQVDVDGTGRVEVVFVPSGNHSRNVQLGSDFNGTLAISGLFELTACQVGSTATYEFASGEFWTRGGSVSNNINVVGDSADAFRMRSSGNLTLTGKVTGNYSVGHSENAGTIILANINSGSGTIDLDYGTLQLGNDASGGAISGVAFDDMVINTADGTNLTIKIKASDSETSGGAYQFGAALNISGTVNMTIADGSYHYSETVSLAKDSHLIITNTWDKNQFFSAINAEDATLTLKASNSDRQRLFLLNSDGTFNIKGGKIKLENNSGAVYGFGLAVQKSGAIAETAVEFSSEDSDKGTVLLFTDADYREQNTLAGTDHAVANATRVDGSVAGLSGTKGKVYAAGLTINTGADTSYTYGGELNITSLTKSGAGAQSLTQGLNLTGALNVQAGTLTLAGIVDVASITNTGIIDITSVETLTIGDLTATDGGSYAIGTLTGYESKDWNALLGLDSSLEASYDGTSILSITVSDNIVLWVGDAGSTWDEADENGASTAWKQGEDAFNPGEKSAVVLGNAASLGDLNDVVARTIILDANTVVGSVTVQDAYSLSVAEGESHSFDAGTIVLDGGSLRKTGAGTLSMSLEDAVTAQMYIDEGTLSISETLSNYESGARVDLTALSGVGTLSITAAGASGVTGDDTGQRTVVDLANSFTGTLAVVGGNLDMASTIGGTGSVLLDGATLVGTGGVVQELGWNIAVSDNDAYLRRFGYDNSDGRGDYATRLTGALTGSADAMLKVIDAGEWFLAGDMSGYQGGMSIEGNTNYVTFESSATLASLTAVNNSHILVDNNATLTVSALAVSGTIYTGATEGATFDMGAVSIAADATLKLEGAGAHTLSTLAMGNNATLELAANTSASITTAGTTTGTNDYPGVRDGVRELNGTDFTIKVGTGAELTDAGAWELSGGADMVVSGGGVYHVAGVGLSMRAQNSTSLTIEADTTLHITGTNTTGSKFGDSFSLGCWDPDNTVTVRGTLELECGLSTTKNAASEGSSYKGYTAINVESGGKLAFNNGLHASVSRRGAYTNGDNVPDYVKEDFRHVAVDIAGGGVLEISGTNNAGAEDVYVTLQNEAIVMGGGANGNTKAVFGGTVRLGSGFYAGAVEGTSLTLNVSPDGGWVHVLGSQSTVNVAGNPVVDTAGNPVVYTAGGTVEFGQESIRLNALNVDAGGTARINHSAELYINEWGSINIAGTLIFDSADTITLNKAINNTGTVKILYAADTQFVLRDALLQEVEGVSKTWTLVDNNNSGSITGWDALKLENFLLDGNTLQLGDWDAVSIADGKVMLYMLSRYWDSVAGEDSNVWDTNSGTVWRDRETMEGLVYESGSRVVFGEYEDVDDINQGTGTTPLNKSVTVADAGVQAKSVTITGTGYVFSGGKVAVTDSLNIQESAEFDSTLVIGSTSTPLSVDVREDKTLTVGTLETSSSVSYGNTIYNNGAFLKTGKGTLRITDAIYGTITGATVSGGKLVLGVAGTDEIAEQSVALMVGANTISSAGGSLENVVLQTSGTVTDYTGATAQALNVIKSADGVNYAALTDVQLSVGAASSYATLQKVAFAGTSALSGYITFEETKQQRQMAVASGGTLTVSNLTFDLHGLSAGTKVLIENEDVADAAEGFKGTLEGWNSDNVTLLYSGIAVNSAAVDMDTTAGVVTLKDSHDGNLYWDGLVAGAAEGDAPVASNAWDKSSANWSASVGTDGDSAFLALSNTYFGATPEGGSKVVNATLDMVMSNMFVTDGGYSFTGSRLATLGNMSITPASGEVSFANELVVQGNVNLSAAQDGSVTLGGALQAGGTITATGEGTLSFNSTVQSGGDISLTGNGVVTLSGNVSTAGNFSIGTEGTAVTDKADASTLYTIAGALTAKDILINMDASEHTAAADTGDHLVVSGNVSAMGDSSTTDADGTITLLGSAAKKFTGYVTADTLRVNAAHGTLNNVITFTNVVDVNTLEIAEDTYVRIAHEDSDMDTVLLGGTLYMDSLNKTYDNGYDVYSTSDSAELVFGTIGTNIINLISGLTPAEAADDVADAGQYNSISVNANTRFLTVNALADLKDLTLYNGPMTVKAGEGAIHGNLVVRDAAGLVLTENANNIMAEGPGSITVDHANMNLNSTTQTLRSGNDIYLAGGAITGNANGVGLNFADSSTINYGGSNTISANMTVTDGKTLTLKADYAASQSQSTVALSSDDTLLLSGALSGTGALNLTGDGVVTINKANSAYTGTVTVGGGSSLELTHVDALSKAAISLAGDGTLVLNAGAPVNVAGLTIADGATLSLIGLAPKDAADLTAAGLINADTNGINWTKNGGSLTLNILLDQEVENMMTYNLFTDKQALATSGVTLKVFHNGQELDASQYNVGYDTAKKLVYIRTMLGNIWDGGADGNGDGTWSTDNTDKNWSGSDYVQSTAYNDAIFADLTGEGAQNAVVTIQGTVNPGDVYFESGTTVYELYATADGAMLAAGNVIHKAGAADVTLNLANNDTAASALGGMDLQAGATKLAADLAVKGEKGEVSVAAGATLQTGANKLLMVAGDAAAYTAQGTYSGLTMDAKGIAGVKDALGVVTDGIINGAAELNYLNLTGTGTLTGVTIGSEVNVATGATYTLNGRITFLDTLQNAGTVLIGTGTTVELGGLAYDLSADGGSSIYQLIHGGTISGMDGITAASVYLNGVSLANGENSGLASGIATVMSSSDGTVTISIGKVLEGGGVDGSITAPVWDARWGKDGKAPALAKRFGGATNMFFNTDTGYLYTHIVSAGNAAAVNAGKALVVSIDAGATAPVVAAGNSSTYSDHEVWIYDHSAVDTVVGGRYFASDAEPTGSYNQNADTHLYINTADAALADQKTWVVGGSWNAAHKKDSYVTVQDGNILTLVGGSYGANQDGSTHVYVDGGTVAEVFAGGFDVYQNAGYYGDVSSSNLTITGGTLGLTTEAVNKRVYGGSYYGTVHGDVNVTVKGDATITKLVGGGYHGAVEGNITIKLLSGTVTERVDAAGAGDSSVTGNVSVYLSRDFDVSAGLFGGKQNNSGVTVGGTSTLYLTDAGEYVFARWDGDDAGTHDGYNCELVAGSAVTIAGFDVVSLAQDTVLTVDTRYFDRDITGGTLLITGNGIVQMGGKGGGATRRDIRLENGATFKLLSSYTVENFAADYKAYSKLYVTDGTTFDISGYPRENSANDGGGSIAYHVYLNGDGVDGMGALYKGATEQNNSTNPSGKAALGYIELTGNASATAEHNIAMIGSSNATTYLDLNGYTYTKRGEGAYVLRNTQINGGTYYAHEGTVQPERNTTGADADLVLSDAATLKLNDNCNFTMRSLTGAGDTELGAFKLTLAPVSGGKYYAEFMKETNSYDNLMSGTGFAYGVYSGKITGSGSLYIGNKASLGDHTGVQYLSGTDSTYSGGTHVEAGRLYLLSSTQGSISKGSSSVTSGPIGTGALYWDSTTAEVYLGHGVTVYNSGGTNSAGSDLILGVEGAPNNDRLSNYPGVNGTVVKDGVTYYEVDTHNLQSISCDGVYADGTAYVAGTEIDRNKMLLVTEDNWNSESSTVKGFTDTGYNEATYSGVLSGAAALVKVGAGTLVIDQANAYTGGTRIEAGTLKLKGWAQIGAAADGTIDVTQKAGSTLMLAYDGTYGDELTSISNNMVLNGTGDARWDGSDETGGDTAALISDVGSGVTFTLSGDISGDGNLLHSGEGTLVLSGDSSYKGGMHATRGVVEVQSSMGLGAGVVTVDSASDLHVTVEDGTTASRLTTTIKAPGSSVKGDVVISGTESTERILNVATGGYDNSSTMLHDNGTLLVNGSAVSAQTDQLKGSGTVAVSDATGNGASANVGQMTDYTGDLHVEGNNASIVVENGIYSGGSISVSGSGANVSTNGDVTIVSGESLSLTSKGNAGTTDTSAAVRTTGAVNVTNGATLSVAAAETSYEYNLQNLQASASLNDVSDLVSGAENQAYTAMGTSAEEVYKGFFNTSLAMNQKAAGSVDAKEGGLTLSGGASYETSMANTSLMGGTLTLDTTTTSLLNFDTTLDAGAAAIDGSGRTTQLVLFSDVGGVNFVLDGEVAGAGSGIYYTRADRYIGGCGYVDEETWLVYDSGAGVVYLDGLIPEPTTATLSLLALAALAARRRRK